MGNFYTAHVLKGPAQQDVLSALRGRPALVSTTTAGFTTVLDEACEIQDGVSLAALAEELSAKFSCSVFAVMNHDDDVLYFELYEAGTKTDEYNSNPNYFGEWEVDGPSGGDARRLCESLQAGDAATVEAVLRKDDYVFETERHRDLALALGMPDFSVGVGYNYARAGDFMPGTSNGAFEHSAV